jgi:error-prone DNA polymerase
MAYAELQIASNFSFLRGASHPAELVEEAHRLGLAALAITDRNSFAGIVRAHAAARDKGLRLVVGTRLDFADAPSCLAYPTDRAAYGRLAQLLTDGKRRAAKGECRLLLADLWAQGAGQRLVALPPEEPDRPFAAALATMARHFPGAVSLAAHHLYRGDDGKRLARLGVLAAEAGTPLVATNDVHAHSAARRPLQDVLTCIREGCTLAEAGFRLHANAERHLKSPMEMARLFRARPDAIARSVEIASACRFSLDELKYEYPSEPVPEGSTAQAELERLTWLHAAERYPAGISDKISGMLQTELALIAELDYARYFLTVYEIVKFARDKDILCQGRGSAANSAVCYVLGITAVAPERVNLLFARFVSTERKEPPDIDVDFEHERREEVIQHIYEKYGRERAGIVATVITYRAKSAMRDVGKAFGLSTDAIAVLASSVWGWGRDGVRDAHIREAGFDPADPTLRRVLTLARELMGFPRHLSQHTGGFVITKDKLSQVVPIENAAMADRTVIEWDKDDLDELGMLKIDVLALGMLTCLRKGFDLLAQHYGVKRQLYDLKDEDPRVYDMLCRADSVGVFQVESRAQMTMLPRLRPRKFYDLVVEVAIVRPGPIQGDMVHPYLRRRDGKEPVELPSEALREVLGDTFGVPLFQEQAMRIAIIGAGFSPAEANQLRRAMATFRHVGTIGTLKERFLDGMMANHYQRDFAERCFRQIEGFGDYGFPESHAASFALLVYASAWIKCHYPAVFACAILNSQPMGFYAPAQLVRDAREHGVEVRPVDINHSCWDHTLEPDEKGGFALRLGFRQIAGFRAADAERLVAARAKGDRATLHGLWHEGGLAKRALEKLADGDAWVSTGLDRRGALWAAKGLASEPPLPLFAAAEPPGPEPAATLPPMALSEAVREDYNHLHLSLKGHPVAFLRDRLAARGMLPASRLKALKDGSRAAVAGVVLVRQQPGTASGVIFMTVEDETGHANIVIWQRVFQRFRRVVLMGQLVAISGRIQRDESGDVIHLVAEKLADLSDELRALATPAENAPQQRLVPPSRDFR